MGRHWPDRLEFGAQLLIEAEALLAAALPEEGCALLLGASAGPHWQVALLWPCLNCWQPAAERRRRFAIDPREQLVAQKWARARGWQLLGSLHSHPASRPIPSTLDGQLAVRPCLLAIAAPAGATVTAACARPWRMRAWWMAEGPEAALPQPREIPLLVVGDRSR